MPRARLFLVDQLSLESIKHINILSDVTKVTVKSAASITNSFDISLIVTPICSPCYGASTEPNNSISIHDLHQ